VSSDYNYNCNVWFSETVIITVLKSVARKRLLKPEAIYVRCDYSVNFSV
jgi:hypothetical protein